MALIYVAKTGNDSTGDGSEATPYLTIYKGVQEMAAGDTVYVKSGTYNEKVFINTAHSGTSGAHSVLSVYTGASVIIDGTDVDLGGGVGNTAKALIHGYQLDYFDIIGFEICNAEKDTTTGLGAGIYCNNDNVSHGHLLFQNLNIHDCYGCGIKPMHYYTTVDLTDNMPGVTIDNCTIHDVDTGLHYEEQYSNPAISVSTVDGLEIKNCTIYNVGMQYSDWTGQEGIVARIGSTNISIHDNNIYACRSGIYMQSQAVAMSNIDIYNNIIHDCFDYGINLGSEISAQDMLNVDIYNNIIYNNAGILGYSGDADGHVYPDTPLPAAYGNGGFGVMAYSFTKTFRLINNTFYNNHKEEIVILDTAAFNTNCVIRNNIIVGSTTDSWGIRYADYATGGITVDHNLYYLLEGTWNSTNILGSNAVMSDPLFVSPPYPTPSSSWSTGDLVSVVSSGLLAISFKLRSGSPAINAGSLTSAPSTDFDGTTRGLLVDIGAYESSETTVVVTTTTTPSFGTSADDLCKELSKSIGDFITFNTTTNLTTSKLIVSTDLNEYDFVSDDYFSGWFVYVANGNNAGQERRIYDYATSTGTITVYGANFIADVGAVTCELRRHSRASCLKAINAASKEIFPNLGEYYEDTSIVTGNWLPNGHLDKWSNSTTPDLWIPVNASVGSSGFTMGGGKHSALMTATSAGAYLDINSTTYPRLLQLMNTSITFKAWAYPNTTSNATLIIQTIKADGTTQTLESTTTTYANKWNLIYFEDQQLSDNVTYIDVQLRLANAGTTCYWDNAQLFGKSIEQYFCPTVVRNGKILGVYVQSGQYSNDTLDPCDNSYPESWKRLYNWHYWFDNMHDWLEIPGQQERLKIRVITLNALDQLTSGSDSISLDGYRVNLLLAYARYKLYQQQRSVPSSQDVTRFDKFMSEALAEYNRLLPTCRLPQVLETVRVRY